MSVSPGREVREPARLLLVGVPASRSGSAPSSWTARIRPVVAQARLICSIARQTRQEVAAEAAVLLGERQREDVLGGEQLADVLRELAGPVDLGGARRDPLVGEHADGVAEERSAPRSGGPTPWALALVLTAAIVAACRVREVAAAQGQG